MMSTRSEPHPHRVFGEDAPPWLPWGLALVGALGAVTAATLTIQGLSSGFGALASLQAPWVEMGSATPRTGGDHESAPAEVASTQPEVATLTADLESAETARVGPLERAREGASDQGPPAEPLLVPQGPDEAAEGPSVAADSASELGPGGDRRPPSESPPEAVASGTTGEIGAESGTTGPAGVGEAIPDQLATDSAIASAVPMEPVQGAAPPAMKEVVEDSGRPRHEGAPGSAQGPETEPQAEHATAEAPAGDHKGETPTLAEAESKLPMWQPPDLAAGELDQAALTELSSVGSAGQAGACPPLLVVRFDRDAVRPIEADLDRRMVELADLLMAHPEARLVVAGHTDAAGDSAYNLALSHRRADMVAGLLTDAGVPAQQLVVRGYGETAPLRQAGDPGLNRRVSLSLIGYEGCPKALSD